MALAATVSGAIAIAAASGLLPMALLFAFKPLTTVLILAFAWPRGADTPRQRMRIRIGLGLSLVGDVALLWPKEGFLPGLVAFLLAHLAYIGAFCVPVRFAARTGPFVGYAVVAGGVLAWLWPGVPVALRAPVIGYVMCLGAMAAQAAAWWLSGRGTAAEDRVLARRAAVGGLLFLMSDSLLAVGRFAGPLPFGGVGVLPSYWGAQGLIAGALKEAPDAMQTDSAEVGGIGAR